VNTKSGDGETAPLSRVTNADCGGEDGARASGGGRTPLEQVAEDGVADGASASAIHVVIFVAGHCEGGRGEGSWDTCG
jgi:hypothetical protein